MHRGNSEIFSLILIGSLLLCCWKFAAVNAESNDGPSNQVAYRGDPVFIECKDERDSNECLTWRFHAVTADNPKTIVFNSSIVATSFTRVTMIARNEDNKKDDLLIPRAGAEDAGTYYCMGGKQYTAELIIFDSDPKCHVSVNSAVYYKSSTPVYLHENDVIVMSCTVAYWGNWPPTMKWTITGGAILKTDTLLGDKTIQNKTMSSSHTLKISSSLDKVRFTCFTYFVLDNKPDEKFGSTNIPVYQNTWESPTINLLQRKQSDLKSDESTQKSKDADPIHTGLSSPDNSARINNGSTTESTTGSPTGSTTGSTTAEIVNAETSATSDTSTVSSSIFISTAANESPETEHTATSSVDDSTAQTTGSEQSQTLLTSNGSTVGSQATNPSNTTCNGSNCSTSGSSSSDHNSPTPTSGSDTLFTTTMGSTTTTTSSSPTIGSKDTTYTTSPTTLPGGSTITSIPSNDETSNTASTSIPSTTTTFIVSTEDTSTTPTTITTTTTIISTISDLPNISGSIETQNKTTTGESKSTESRSRPWIGILVPVLLAICVLVGCMAVREYRRRRAASGYSTLNDDFNTYEGLTSPPYGYNQDQEL